jgi:hypothetical protein
MQVWAVGGRGHDEGRKGRVSVRASLKDINRSDNTMARYARSPLTYESVLNERTFGLLPGTSFDS